MQYHTNFHCFISKQMHQNKYRQGHLIWHMTLHKHGLKLLANNCMVPRRSAWMILPAIKRVTSSIWKALEKCHVSQENRTFFSSELLAFLWYSTRWPWPPTRPPSPSVTTISSLSPLSSVLPSYLRSLEQKLICYLFPFWLLRRSSVDQMFLRGC